MWKNLCNICNAAVDLAVIAGKEIGHQLDSASTATEDFTTQMATKAAELRAEYEKSLEVRCNSSITASKTEVVTNVPGEAVHVN